jgi:cell division protein FtsN
MEVLKHAGYTNTVLNDTNEEKGRYKVQMGPYDSYEEAKKEISALQAMDKR